MIQSSSSNTCLCHYFIKILNLFDPELQLINTKPIIKKINNKPIIKNKLKYMLSKLKNFKVHSILVLEYKERNDHKIFH